MSVYTCQFTFSEAEINGEGISTRKCYALVQFTKFVYSWRGKKKKKPQTIQKQNNLHIHQRVPSVNGDLQPHVQL